MLKLDRLDIKLTPYLDRLVNCLRLGFIMTAELYPECRKPYRQGAIHGRP
jgi:hypothetical protein